METQNYKRKKKKLGVVGSTGRDAKLESQQLHNLLSQKMGLLKGKIRHERFTSQADLVAIGLRVQLKNKWTIEITK